MIDYSSLNRDKAIRWLSDVSYANNLGYAVMPFHPGLEGIARYDELGTFHTEPVSYRNVTGGPLYPNKRGEVNVFCNGNVQIIANGAVAGTQDVDSPSIEVIPLSIGVNTVYTRLSGIDCFAVVVKNPLDRDHPDFFNLLYYATNRPSIPSASSNPVTVRVEDRMPELRDTLVQITEATIVPDTYLIEITVRNYGDVPVRITGVSSPSTASPFGASCSFLGIPSPPCPSDNGFDQSISVGGTHTVYVLYTGSLSGTVITLVYEPMAPIRSSETEFELDVSLESDIVRCEIEPPTLAAGQYEVHDYEVTCYNLFSEAVPCAGADWYWADGLSGGFIERTNSFAWAYTSSSAGSTGTLNYRTGSVICSADITSSEISPYFDCELDPSSADLEIGDSEYFDLNCYVDGVESPPSSAEYDNVDGLDGSITGSSIAGTTFTGTVISDGNLMAFARKSLSGDPTLLGAVAFAHINVGNATETPETPGTGGDEPCEIRPGTDDLYPHDGGLLTLYCGEEGARTLCSISPSNVDWGMASELYGGIVANTGTTATYVVGSTGTPAYGYYNSAIRATIYPGTDDEGSCWANINIVEPTCLEYS